MGSIEAAYVQRCQSIAILEHPPHICDFGSIKTAYVQRCQSLAKPEYPIHICDVGSVETTQIQFCQTVAAIEHPGHICDIGGVKAAYIQWYQFAAAAEHLLHTCDVGGVQIAEIVNLRQIAATTEPARRRLRRNRIHEVNLCNRHPCLKPRRCSLTIQSGVSARQIDGIRRCNGSSALRRIAVLECKRPVGVQNRVDVVCGRRPCCQ